MLQQGCGGEPFLEDLPEPTKAGVEEPPFSKAIKGAAAVLKFLMNRL